MHTDLHTHTHTHTPMHTHTHTHTPMHTHTHTQTRSHTSQRLCESQNAEPEGCCVSDVCIVYSVVPVHVGDCCTLRPHSSLVLFTMTGVDSGLLSRRAERPSEERGEKRRRRSKETERDHWRCLFPLYLFTHCFSLLFGFSSLIPSSQTSAPMGHQLSDSQRRVPPLFLSSLTLTFFAVWDTHRFAPGESFGNPR